MENTAMEERPHHFHLVIITDCWVRRLHMVHLRSRIIMIWNINCLAGIAVLWNHRIRNWPLSSGIAAAGCALRQSREHRLLRLTLNPMRLIMQNFTHFKPFAVSRPFKVWPKPILAFVPRYCTNVFALHAPTIQEGYRWSAQTVVNVDFGQFCFTGHFFHHLTQSVLS